MGNEGQSQHHCGIQSELKASLSNLYESLCPSENNLKWPDMSRGFIHINLFSIKERESTETTLEEGKVFNPECWEQRFEPTQWEFLELI